MEYHLGGTVDVQTDQQTDEQLSPIIVALVDNTPLPRGTALGLKQCFLKDGMLCRKFQRPSNFEYTQLVLPSSLHPMALQHLHNELGHLGFHKTMEAKDIIGLDMKETSGSGLQSVPHVSNAVPHNLLHRLRWGLSPLAIHLTRYLGIIWAHCHSQHKGTDMYWLGLICSANGQKPSH